MISVYLTFRNFKYKNTLLYTKFVNEKENSVN